MNRIKNTIRRIYRKIFFAVDNKTNMEYRIEIDKGRNSINDFIFNFIIGKLKHHKQCAYNEYKSFNYLDIGCNIGVILKDVEGGKGVDNSEYLVKVALNQGLDVRLADALNLPFNDNDFDIAVLSCVLEQNENWADVLMEAKRVARVVIGINPVPGSDWGKIGGYVKAVIPMKVFPHVELLEDIDKYYFEY
jgi:ubiquinone/menaquinone biosynthesis C-methylase UbiE